MLHISENGLYTPTRMQLLAWLLQVQAPGRSSGCGGKNHFCAGDTHLQMR